VLNFLVLIYIPCMERESVYKQDGDVNIVLAVTFHFTHTKVDLIVIEESLVFRKEL